MTAIHHTWRRQALKFRAIATVFIIAAAVIVSCAGLKGQAPKQQAGISVSPSALALDTERGLLYIAESDARRIDVVQTSSDSIVHSFEIGIRPNGLVLNRDGTVLYAACGSDRGMLLAIDTANGSIINSSEAGHTPLSPVLTPNESRLFVCSRFENSVLVFDPATLNRKWSIPALREPVAQAITPDGRYLFIANHLPSGKMIQEYVTDGGVYMIGSYMSTGYFNTNRESYVFSAVVLVYDTQFNRLVELIKLPNGSSGVRGICVSPDGKNVYLTHILARYHLPTTQLERGWMNTNALSVIDVESLKLKATALLDDLDRGAANPWGVACTGDGANIAVALSGTHELSIIDRRAFHARLDSLSLGLNISAASRSLADVQNDLSFLYGIRERLPVRGFGPRAVAAGYSDVYAAGYFSDTIEHIDLESPERKTSAIPLSRNTVMDSVRLGELYFNDARLCFQGWQSCASCHPDGRADGLSWDLLNDGIGNPKNTKNLLYSHLTPPVMSLGVRDDAETAVRAGMRFIQFSEKPEFTAEAIDAYLMAMKPENSPGIQYKDRERALSSGKKIFRSAGCADCHSGPLFTDQHSYDIGQGVGKDAGKLFDTPSLVEVWRTAPYLYDGRADTMYDVLKTFNKNDLHGVTSTLSQMEISDLIEYLMSI